VRSPARRVTLHYLTPVVKNLLSSDKRFVTLQAETEMLLEDAELAAGDEDTDAYAIAKELADELRAELSGALKMVAKNESWDAMLDQVGILKAFDAPPAIPQLHDPAGRMCRGSYGPPRMRAASGSPTYLHQRGGSHGDRMEGDDECRLPGLQGRAARRTD
jgi:hypothetical protein